MSEAYERVFDPRGRVDAERKPPAAQRLDTAVGEHEPRLRMPRARAVDSAARIEHRNALRYQQRCQGNVLGNHQVAHHRVLHDITVGDIRTAVHPHRADHRVPGRSLQEGVGDQNRGKIESFRGEEHQVLHIAWRGVGIDINRQGH